MEIYHYQSIGGKDVIKAYVDKLNKTDQLHFYEIESLIRANGIDAIKDSFKTDSELNRLMESCGR